ncbi:hypothetical protein [Nocardioides dongkuii]|uniref:hypothetical protein n=1 Tax=Nocardioides dongkuii TaxID=2760089 RepID=UPI0015FDBF3E|nr:hypothetical protein [Nocardioides dongkuii]
MRDRVTGTRGHTSPRHVWVCVTGRWHEQSPGVLLEWRRGTTSWEALVIWAGGGGVRTWEVKHGWVPAAHVRPRE